MKVGILTLMHGFNYGGMLQCYALVQALQNLGHRVEVIDYDPRKKWRLFQRASAIAMPQRAAKAVQEAVNEYRFGKALVGAFNDFRKNSLPISTQIRTQNALSEYMKNFDAVIVGSDQVWNTHWFTPEYFLDFEIGDSVKKISYAACFGSANQKSEFDAIISRKIGDFDSLSVRNQFSAHLVRDLSGKDPFIACDPTLLDDVFKLANEADIQESRYILLYAMSEARMKKAVEYAEGVSRSYGLPILAVKTRFLQPWDMPENIKIISDPSVGQWVWLIENAAHVVTDSFHGTILAIQRTRNVTNYIGRDPGAIRTDDIFSRYGLHNDGDYVVVQDHGGSDKLFLSAQDKMRSHAKSSREFIDSALG